MNWVESISNTFQSLHQLFSTGELSAVSFSYQTVHCRNLWNYKERRRAPAVYLSHRRLQRDDLAWKNCHGNLPSCLCIIKEVHLCVCVFLRTWSWSIDNHIFTTQNCVIIGLIMQMFDNPHVPCGCSASADIFLGAVETVMLQNGKTVCLCTYDMTHRWHLN